MKRFITLIAVILPMIATAQEHLQYEGINIDGNITEFSKKLTEQGLTFVQKVGDDYIFSGEDNVKNNYSLLVSCTPEDKGALVYRVIRMTRAIINFSQLEYEYKKWQRKFDKMYGEGVYDEYIDSVYDDSDMGRYVALQNGKGNYLSEYRTNQGEITLTITLVNSLGYVATAYIDRKNMTIAEKYIIE